MSPAFPQTAREVAVYNAGIAAVSAMLRESVWRLQDRPLPADTTIFRRREQLRMIRDLADAADGLKLTAEAAE